MTTQGKWLGKRRSAAIASLVRGATLAGVVAMAGLAQQAEAAFPGANGKISFVSNRDGDAEVYSMNPDSTKVAFASDRDGGDQEIYVMNAATGSKQVNRTNSNVRNDFTPDWGVATP